MKLLDALSMVCAVTVAVIAVLTAIEFERAQAESQLLMCTIPHHC